MRMNRGPEQASIRWKAERLKQVTIPLLQWYEEHARDLPWRREPSPYHVWVSEIMLQQTRVEAVKPYYGRFLAELPDIRSLAECPQDRLLKLWEGLGYYSRVRNMQKAAQMVCQQYHGELPADYELLLELPGLGSYTAGAIASIAYGLPVPAVDGNVLRVVSRICADDGEITSQKVKHQWEWILKQVILDEETSCRDMLQADRPFFTPRSFNQAMMELGATVCLPNGQPLCASCPIRGYCEAGIRGKTMDFPVKKPAKKRRIEDRTVFVLRLNGKYLLHRRPENGLLAGLYEFPNAEGFLDTREALNWLTRNGWPVFQIEEITETKHIFSHVEWHMHGYMAEIDPHHEYVTIPGRSYRDYLLAWPEEITGRYSIPSAFSAYLKYILPLKTDKKTLLT